mmetsp:Transcript_44058/g.121958  ORF Transcript_44058/g.121958 Transcript_44058/m.121958 type:complete len:291 (-) Transcript_44058:53-925(-)
MSRPSWCMFGQSRRLQAFPKRQGCVALIWRIRSSSRCRWRSSSKSSGMAPKFGGSRCGTPSSSSEPSSSSSRGRGRSCTAAARGHADPLAGVALPVCSQPGTPVRRVGPTKLACVTPCAGTPPCTIRKSSWPAWEVWSAAAESPVGMSVRSEFMSIAPSSSGGSDARCCCKAESWGAAALPPCAGRHRCNDWRIRAESSSPEASRMGGDAATGAAGAEAFDAADGSATRGRLAASRGSATAPPESETAAAAPLPYPPAPLALGRAVRNRGSVACEAIWPRHRHPCFLPKG